MDRSSEIVSIFSILKGVAFAIPFFLLPKTVWGQVLQGRADSNTIRSLGLGASYTTTLVHTPEVNEVRGSRPFGLSFSYQHQYLDRATYEHCGCYPRTGVLGGWFHLDDPGTLGNSYYAAGFVEPFIWAGKSVDLSLRGVMGGAYLTTPYHPVKNPENKAYSTHLSFFLELGVYAHVRVGPRSTIKFGAVYDHASNGGVALPNKGLNHPGVSLTYERSFSHQRFPEREAPSSGGRERSPRIDLTFFGGGKTVGTDHSTFYPFAGHSIDWAYPLSSLHTVTLGGEWVVDGGLKEELRRRSTHADPQRLSLNIGHEFLMGRFIFSQRLGVYLYDPSRLDDPIYHRWGLTYHLTPSYFIGIDLKAHRHIADFIDLRAGISLGNEQEKRRAVN